MPTVIVTAAITGGIHGKEISPCIPEQPDEIVREAVASVEAGASVLHLHARDAAGKPTGDLNIFREINERVKAKTDAIVQLSTGGHEDTIANRFKIIDLKPEMASLNTSMAVFFLHGKEYLFENYRSDIERFAGRMLEKGVKPELECYSLESIYEVENLISKGLLKKPYYINLVLNIYAQGAIKGNYKNLTTMIGALPDESIFNVTAIGSTQLSLTTMSVLLGGHCRVGLEDNIYYSKGVLAESNAQLVARSVRIIKELGFSVATPDQAREILKI